MSFLLPEEFRGERVSGESDAEADPRTKFYSEEFKERRAKFLEVVGMLVDLYADEERVIKALGEEKRGALGDLTVVEYLTRNEDAAAADKILDMFGPAVEGYYV